MKIDLIKKKHSEKPSEYDEYLKFVCSDIKDFYGINDLIISKIFKV